MKKIAIVGRPNVGKSALFNRIVGKRIAIVDEAEGVTRDRLYAEAECFGNQFEVIDTGGIHAKSVALFNAEVKQQAEIAIEEGDGLIMVVDAIVGPTDLDLELARILRRKGKPLVLAVNKVDNQDQEVLVHQFHALGIDEMVPVSAVQGLQIAELLEKLPLDAGVPADPSTKIAIIGRPNVGKSTLVNGVLDEDRCIVSPIPGTTRDSIDTPVEIEGERYTLIDTAGIRRKKGEHEVVDKFAAIRTERAIERADICVLMLDAQQGLTTQEKRIATDIEKAGKGCVIFFNKWDQVKEVRMEHCQRDMYEQVPFLRHCPIIFGSALTGRNLDKVFEEVVAVRAEQAKRITTGELNRFMMDALHQIPPPMVRGKRLRIYYLTQVSNTPPRFLLFVNYPDLMTQSYKKYLVNQFRKRFSFRGCPLVFDLKGRRTLERKHGKGEVPAALT